MVGFLFSSHFHATKSSKLIYNFLFEAILPFIHVSRRERVAICSFIYSFFDIATYVNSSCNQNKFTESIFEEREKTKKRKYKERVIDVKMGFFTPSPGFWHECKDWGKNF